jgi:4-amino-4-deoxy-L-arabinose transferase-like glycosyltransferase
VALAAQQLVARQPYSLSAWGLFALAVVLTWRASRSTGTPAPAPVTTVTSASMRYGQGAAAVVLLGAVTIVSVADRWRLMALAGWLLAFACATWSLRGCVVTPPRRVAPSWTTTERAALALILLVAAAARVAWLDGLPRYYFGDEARVGVFLRQAYATGIPNFFTMGWNTWPLIGLSVQGLFAPLLGLSTTTLRLSSALMGTLAVAATYLLARRLFSPRVALLSALVLALCRTAIDFSRLGTCHAQVMLLAPLAFYWWWRAVDTGRGASYLWCGITLGLCLFSYNAGQAVPVIWFAWVLLASLRQPKQASCYWRGVALVLAGLLLAYLPYLVYVTDRFEFAHNWEQFTIMARNRQALGQASDLWRTGGIGPAVAFMSQQAVITWLGFTVLPAGAYSLGYRGGGMLDDVSAPLFILGLALSVSGAWRERGVFVVYWWLVTTIIGGVFTLGPPAVVRLVGLLPALAILVALPLDALARMLATTSRRRIAAALAMAALLAAMAWQNWRTYFVEFASAPVDDTSSLARLVEATPADVPVLLAGSEHFLHFYADVNLELFPFEFPGRRLVDVPDPAHLLPLRESGETAVVVVLAPTQTSLLRSVMSLYPRTRVTDVNWTDGRLLFQWLEIPAEDIRSQQGLERQALDAEGTVLSRAISDPFVPGPDSPAGCAMQSWRGSVYWPTDAAAMLTLHSTEPVVLRIADAEIPQSGRAGSAGTAVQVRRGWQPLDITAASCRPLRLSLEIAAATQTRVLSRADLRPTRTSEGLTADYDRDGQPLARTIDPQVNSVAVESLLPVHAAPDLVRMPFVAKWSGFLRVRDAGTYGLRADASGSFAVVLDGETILQADEPAPDHTAVASATFDLAPGDHPVEARFEARGTPTRRRLFQLFWKPPGGEWELVPAQAFVPHG